MNYIKTKNNIMEKIKINVAELLRNCPSGMELDCTMFYDVVFDHISVEPNTHPIFIKIKNCDSTIQLTEYGQYMDIEDAKCVIFPKGRTTWEGFVPPCQFKDGDIIFTRISNYKWVSIFKQLSGSSCCTYVDLCMNDNDLLTDTPSLCTIEDIDIQRLATEDEKLKLFDTIKADGYKWNSETKTLGKLIEPQFKVGDRIKRKGDTRLTTIKDIKDNYYIITIPDYFDNAYITDKLSFSNQDEYELVPNKFDITTLKPFDRVLVRTKNFTPVWTIDFYDGYQPNIGGSFTPFGVTSGKYFQQCIPYEGNEHLLGTTNDCGEYYKTWK